MPDDHPLTIGGIGLLGTAPSRTPWRRATRLFMVGTNFPYTKYLPEPGQCQGRPDRVRSHPGWQPRCHGGPADRATPGTLTGRSAAISLEQSRIELPRPLPRRHGRVASNGWRALEADRRRPDPAPAAHGLVDRLASERRDPDVGLGNDRHLGGPPLRRSAVTGVLPVRQPRHDGAGPSLHHRQSAGASGPPVHRLRRRRRLRDADGRVRDCVPLRLPIKVVINNNASLGQILWEQLVLGYPEFGVRFDRRGRTSPRGPRPAAGGASGWTSATSSSRRWPMPSPFRGPALVDVTVNPDEPPMPGKFHYEQAKGFVKAFLSGQPRQAAIAGTSCRDKIGRSHSAVRSAPTRPRSALDRRHARRHRPSVRMSARPLRTIHSSGLTAVGALISRRGDLARARSGQLLEQDDVASGRPHARLVGRRVRRGLLPAGREDGRCPLVSWSSSRTACRASTCTCAGWPSAREASRLARYNIEMGPPTFAPLLFGLVGGMGLLAAVLRRER